MAKIHILYGFSQDPSKNSDSKYVYEIAHSAGWLICEDPVIFFYTRPSGHLPITFFFMEERHMNSCLPQSISTKWNTNKDLKSDHKPKGHGNKGILYTHYNLITRCSLGSYPGHPFLFGKWWEHLTPQHRDTTGLF